MTEKLDTVADILGMIMESWANQHPHSYYQLTIIDKSEGEADGDAERPEHANKT